MRSVIFAAAALMLLAASPAGARGKFPEYPTGETGYWVIVATFPADLNVLEAVQTTAAPCHVRVYNDHASRFGFSDRSDLNAFVLSNNRYPGDGLYATYTAAKRKADSVRRRFPDAYVKFGHETGE
jgi:hypothetical protein